MELISSRDEFQPIFFFFVPFQWNSSLLETSSSQIIFFFITTCAFAPEVGEFKNFVELVFLHARMPRSIATDAFFNGTHHSWNSSIPETRLNTSLVSKQCFFAKLFLKSAYRAKSLREQINNKIKVK
jgi:hypothetical protein